MIDDCHNDNEVAHDLMEHTSGLDNNRYKIRMVWDLVERKYVGYWVGIKGGQTLYDGLQLRSWTGGLARARLENFIKTDNFSRLDSSSCQQETNHNIVSSGRESEAENVSESESGHIVENPCYTPPTPPNMLKTVNMKQENGYDRQDNSTPQIKTGDIKREYKNTLVSCPINCCSTTTAYKRLSTHLRKSHSLNFDESKIKCSQCHISTYDVTMDLHTKLRHSSNGEACSNVIKNKQLDKSHEEPIIRIKPNMDEHKSKYDTSNCPKKQIVLNPEPVISKKDIKSKSDVKVKNMNSNNIVGFYDSGNLGILLNQDSEDSLTSVDGQTRNPEISASATVDKRAMNVTSERNVEQNSYAQINQTNKTKCLNSKDPRWNSYYSCNCCSSVGSTNSSSKNKDKSCINNDTLVMKTNISSKEPNNLSSNNLSLDSVDALLDSEDDSIDEEAEGKKKKEWKKRRRFSKLEKGVLNEVLAQYTDPPMKVKCRAAKILGLPVRVVLGWFSRMKYMRDKVQKVQMKTFSHM